MCGAENIIYGGASGCLAGGLLVTVLIARQACGFCFWGWIPIGT
jgi:hypothetical protein